MHKTREKKKEERIRLKTNGFGRRRRIVASPYTVFLSRVAVSQESEHLAVALVHNTSEVSELLSHHFLSHLERTKLPPPKTYRSKKPRVRRRDTGQAFQQHRHSKQKHGGVHEKRRTEPGGLRSDHRTDRLQSCSANPASMFSPSSLRRTAVPTIHRPIADDDWTRSSSSPTQTGRRRPSDPASRSRAGDFRERRDDDARWGPSESSTRRHAVVERLSSNLLECRQNFRHRTLEKNRLFLGRGRNARTTTTTTTSHRDHLTFRSR